MSERTADVTDASPLEGEHAELGARFTDFAGWRMPLRYDSELAEHHAVRTAAGLFDLSHMGEIAVRGGGAGQLLDRALAGRLSRVAVGRAKYALICTPDGGVLDDLVVYRLAEDNFLVVANASNAAVVAAELAERGAGIEDVRVEDVSAGTALVAVQGPAAASIIGALVASEAAADVAELKYYAVTPAQVAGAQVLLARTGYTGEDGFELYVAEADAVRLWRALLEQTRAQGGSPAGLGCRDTLRLEAGMPLYGHELTTDTTPYQAGLGRTLDLTKDFVGRDALQRLESQPPSRTLIGLVGAGRRAARAGYPVLEAGTGRRVGEVTSGALSLTLGSPIALAYVEPAAVDCELVVDIRGRYEPFTVTPLPFYRRARSTN